MKIIYRSAVLIALCSTAQLTAQTLPSIQPAAIVQPSPDLKGLLDSQKLREDAAGLVATGKEKPSEAIARLQASESPSGLKIDRDADFAFAAIDVGQRLIASGNEVKAEPFFLAAEKSLEDAVGKTTELGVKDKTEFLRKLAFVRATFLGKVAVAKENLEQAIALQPGDKSLQESRDTLVSAHSQFFPKTESQKK